jgi:hypothetical protein
MTTKPKDESSTEEYQEPRFAIDLKTIEAQGRMPTVILASRMCAASKAKLKSPEAVHEMSFAQLRKLIRQNCRKDPEYLSPHLPVMETAFRILLASPKEPVSLSALHDQITQLWIGLPWPRQISIESLARVLSHDSYYGMVVVEEKDRPPA